MDTISKMTLTEKEGLLDATLLEIESAVIAFSGGVDSSLLLHKASSILGIEKVIAVTGISPSYPKIDKHSAEEVIRFTGSIWLTIETSEFNEPGYMENGKDRCFFCKRDLFKILSRIAAERGVRAVLDGSIYDDISDYRPGRRAALIAGVRSPLYEAGIYKKEVRALLKRDGLPNWDKPSSACLASRIPYGTEVTPKRLSQVEEGEEILKGFGFRTSRLRWHENIARIEVDQGELSKAISIRKDIILAIKRIGFTYVCLDIEGLRTGSMNEVPELVKEKTIRK